MYYENDSDETDTIILYDTDDTNSEDNDSIPYSEELQLYEEDDINILTEEVFDDISEDIDNYHVGENNKKWKIGTYKYIRRSKQYLYIMDVPPMTFLKYDSYVISRYFYWHSSFYVAEHPPIDIIEIYEVVEPGSPFPVTYCILKTFWIKIIQRRWKKVFRERQRILQGRKTLASIKYRELNGCFPQGYRVIPRFSLFF
jgi:hypothetical protein